MEKTVSKKQASKKSRLKPLSLYPLKAEEALRLFMQVDPAKVKKGMRQLRQKKGKDAALPTG